MCNSYLRTAIQSEITFMVMMLTFILIVALLLFIIGYLMYRNTALEEAVRKLEGKSDD